jgi:hypothetical protein
VDARDWQFFEFAMQAAPRPPAPGFEPADLDGDGVMSEQDRGLFRDQFRRFRFGPDGVVGERQLAAFHNAFTGPGPGGFQPGVLNLYDLDGDGDVDYADQLILHTLLTEPVGYDLDVSADGRVDVDDLHEQYRTPRDVNRDGRIDEDDANLLERTIREGELDAQRP